MAKETVITAESEVSSKLESENEALREELELTKSKFELVEGRLDRTMEIVEDLQLSIEGTEKESVPQITSMRVLNDPFSAQNPHEFLSQPPGFRLGWINPVYRNKHRTMMGWDPVQYDDSIGQNLGDYLLSPPSKMQDAIDNVVRRGDVILCRLPEEWYQARQQERTRKANRLYKHGDPFKDDIPHNGEFSSLPVDKSGEHIGGSKMQVRSQGE